MSNLCPKKAKISPHKVAKYFGRYYGGGGGYQISGQRFSRVLMGSRSSKYTLFLNKNVVFPAQAEYSYSSVDFSPKIFQYYSQFIAHDISVLDYIGGISYSQCMFSRFVAQFSPLENGISGKHIIVLYLQLLNTKIYPFQYLSLGFILKIFLKFCEFQP